MDVKEIANKKWHHLGKWVEPALAAEVWLEYGGIAQQFVDQKLDKEILYVNGNFFLSKHDSEIFINEAYKAAKNNDKSFFTKILDEVKKVSEELVEESRNIKNPIDFLEKYKNLTGVWMPLNNFALGIEKYVQEVDDSVLSEVKGYLNEKPWTLEQIDEMNELRSLIESDIGKKIESVEDIPKKFLSSLDDHVKKYRWLGTHHFNIAELSVGGLIERMKQEKSSSVAGQSSENKNEESKYLIWLLDVIGFARFKAAETSGYTTFYFKEDLSKLGLKYDLAYEDVVEHTLGEIESERLKKEIADSRRKSVGFYFNGDRTFILSEDQIKDINENLLEIEDTNVKEIKGVVAQKGSARGVVKLVTGPKEMEGFQKGMILVAYETTPDIILAMQKASAIVTDFGGLTSHAAIVARELKKPCIVGTGNATKVLKDGDEVEVDADKGIVKVIT